MAEPATRENLKQYALRALGKPVIEINADDDQLEDRLDEALQYFAQYHYDGIQRAYLKYQYTEADKTRMTADSSESSQKFSSLQHGKRVITLSLYLKVYISNQYISIFKQSLI